MFYPKTSLMENIEFYWRTLIKNIEWIKFSEAKAIFLITIYGVILTITYTNAKDLYPVLNKSILLSIFTFFASLFAITSLAYCFFALNPVLKNDNPNSIVYFGHIKEKFKTSKEYVEYAGKILSNKEKLIENVADQVYQTSKIAWRKFSFVSWAIRFFLVTISILIIEIIIYLIF